MAVLLQLGETAWVAADRMLAVVFRPASDEHKGLGPWEAEVTFEGAKCVTWGDAAENLMLWLKAAGDHQVWQKSVAENQARRGGGSDA